LTKLITISTLTIPRSTSCYWKYIWNLFRI